MLGILHNWWFFVCFYFARLTTYCNSFLWSAQCVQARVNHEFFWKNQSVYIQFHWIFLMFNTMRWTLANSNQRLCFFLQQVFMDHCSFEMFVFCLFFYFSRMVIFLAFSRNMQIIKLNVSKRLWIKRFFASLKFLFVMHYRRMWTVWKIAHVANCNFYFYFGET